MNRIKDNKTKWLSKATFQWLKPSVHRYAIIAFLFFIFLKYFGLNSYKKFISGGVIVDKKYEHVKSIQPPSILICPRNRKTQTGWKNEKMVYDMTSFSPMVCKNITNADNFIQCIDDNTYDRDDLVRFTLGVNKGKVEWKELVSIMHLGKCHQAFLEPGTVDTSHKTALNISLNASVDFYVMLFDPIYYFSTSNPSSFPRILISLRENGFSKYFYIKVIPRTI